MNSKLKEIEAIVRRVGQQLVRAKSSPEQITAKEGHKNFVTYYDQLVQDELETAFAERWPDHHFIAEEQDQNETIGDAPSFIVDPIDGTSNFIHGVPFAAISVAVALNREVVLGVVYNPFLNEMYTAAKGEGAYCNGERLRCPDLPMELTLFCVGMSPYYEELLPKTLELMAQIQPKVTDLRRLGAAALDLCYIASGVQGGFCEFRLQPWDYAAGMLIAREAGAIVTTLDGEEPPLDKASTLLAAGPKTYHQFREEIRL